MNWRLCGVTYPPYARVYDRKREGEVNWLARMALAAATGLLTDAAGYRIGDAAISTETP
jgi:hypothetical protein